MFHSHAACRRQIPFYKHLVPTGLLQQIRVNPRLAVRNCDRSNCFPIKLHRTRAADDAVDVTELPQSPERRDQERLSNAAAAFIFRDAGWTKESLARAV